MNVCILMGSPRKAGNTAALLQPFVQELEEQGSICTTRWLYDLDLRPCLACRTCQQEQGCFGCPQPDAMQQIFDLVLDSDLLVLATPVYSWYCTPPMKVVLDRLVYGMNKFYGAVKGPALWAGKPVALVTTCGYPPEKGADLLEEGIRRYCKHSGLLYRGMLCARHYGYAVPFMDQALADRARAFARTLAAADSRSK